MAIAIRNKPCWRRLGAWSQDRLCLRNLDSFGSNPWGILMEVNGKTLMFVCRQMKGFERRPSFMLMGSMTLFVFVPGVDTDCREHRSIRLRSLDRMVFGTGNVSML